MLNPWLVPVPYLLGAVGGLQVAGGAGWSVARPWGVGLGLGATAVATALTVPWVLFEIVEGFWSLLAVLSVTAEAAACLGVAVGLPPVLATVRARRALLELDAD